MVQEGAERVCVGCWVGNTGWSLMRHLGCNNQGCIACSIAAK